MKRNLAITGTCVLWLAAIVIANLTLAKWGPKAIVPNAMILVGLDLILRDRLADWWGTTRWTKMGLLILAGGLLSYWVNRDAKTIAIASMIAFASAEVVEAVIYHGLRKERWLDRAPRAAMVGAAVDSIVFIWIAFGFDWSLSLTQFCAKVAGAVLWAWVIYHLLPPPSTAPERA